MNQHKRMPMATDKLYLPPECTNDEENSFNRLKAKAEEIGIEVVDLFYIANCKCYNRASIYIDMLRKLAENKILGKKIDTAQEVIKSSVDAFNEYSVLMKFSESVSNCAMMWEWNNSIPQGHLRHEHPAGNDNLRLFIWAQDLFRVTVRQECSDLLTEQHETGSLYSKAASHSGMPGELEPSPVILLCDWLEELYESSLGVHLLRIAK